MIKSVVAKGKKMNAKYLQPKQHESYQKSLLEYWEVKNVMDTSFGEGFIEGEAKGKLEGK